MSYRTSGHTEFRLLYINEQINQFIININNFTSPQLGAWSYEPITIKTTVVKELL